MEMNYLSIKKLSDEYTKYKSSVESRLPRLTSK